MEMVAVDPGHAAMAVAHVFAEANIGDHEQLGAFGLDRANRLLHDAIFGVGAGSRFILFRRNAEKKDGLQAGGLRRGQPLRRSRSGASWSTPGMLLIGAAGADFLVHEKREDEIVRTEIGLAHEVTKGRRCAADGAGDEPISSPAEAKRGGLGEQAVGVDRALVSRPRFVIPSCEDSEGPRSCSCNASRASQRSLQMRGPSPRCAASG